MAQASNISQNRRWFSAGVFLGAVAIVALALAWAPSNRLDGWKIVGTLFLTGVGIVDLGLSLRAFARYRRRASAPTSWLELLRTLSDAHEHDGRSTPPEVPREMPPGPGASSARKGWPVGEHVEPTAMLRLHRLRCRWADRERTYDIHIDRELMASIANDQTVSLPVTPGRHDIVLTIDWCRSPRRAFEVQEREIVDFVCQPAARPATVLLYIGPLRRRYIKLQLMSAAQG